MKKIFLIVLFSTIIGQCFSQNVATPLPATITFERQVVQHMNGEDGKATHTYWFTINGDYAMAKREEPGDDEKATILYTKAGQMCMINEKTKTIMIMSMPKIVGEGAQMGKEVAEKISKKPLPKDDEEKIAVTKTGKTKMICGYTSYEYLMKNEGGSSNWWYAKVDFNPILIYTMGAGKLGSLDKIKNDKKFDDNPFAIPIKNPNYLLAEIEVGGKRGQETVSITKTTYTFSTAGYKVKTIGGLKDAVQKDNDD